MSIFFYRHMAAYHLLFYLFVLFVPSVNAEPAPALLSISQAIEIALKNNPDIRIEKENIQIQKATEQMAAARFDSSLRLNTAIKKRIRRSTSLLETGFTTLNDIQQEDIDWDLGWTKPVPWGGQYDLALNYRRTDATLQKTNPTYFADLSLVVTQPLLKGFGKKIVQGPLTIAATETAISHQTFRARVMEIIQKIVSHYWDLTFQRENLRVQQASLTLAKQLLERNQAKVALGLLAPIEITVAEVGVASREEAVIIAKKGIQDVEDQLRLLMGQHDPNGLFAVEILPSDRPIEQETHLNQDDLLALALAERPERKSLALKMQNIDRSVQVAENQTRPSLDLIGALGPSGTGQHASDPFDQLFSGDFYRWEAGVVLTYPLGNRAAMAALQKERAIKNRAKNEEEKIVQWIGLEVREGTRRVQTDFQRILATRRALDLAKKQHITGEERFRLGLLASHDLIAFQNEVTQAEGNALRAITDYNKSLVNLYWVTGILLAQYKIDIAQ